MEKVKRWFNNRKLGSMESLNMRSQDVHNQQMSVQTSSYELTSIKIKQLLEKEQFQRVVDLLRELNRDYVLGCLESFPFIALNKTVPRSFLIWETLLTKLNNSEEGYIPQFPYKACDELVMNVAWLLENSGDEDLTHSCKRVLKCVFMQYNEVLENLFKEHDRVEYALYTLGLHSLLGTDPRTALSIERAIQEEVRACLEDYSTALERLDDFKKDEVISLADILKEGQKTSPGLPEREKEREGEMMVAPSPTQVQLQERLYQNQRVFTALQPSRRNGTLQQLLELLSERIHGDKAVIGIFGKIRDRHWVGSDSIPVQPWLRKYQHALDLAIGTLKDIEKDLEITIPRVESPMQLCPAPSSASSSAREPFLGGVGVEEGLQIVPGPVNSTANTPRPRSHSYEQEKPVLPPHHYHHRHSITPILTPHLPGEDEKSLARGAPPKRNLSVPYGGHAHRPRSASPLKALRVNGGGGGGGGGVSGAGGGGGGLAMAGRTGSVKSVSSDSSSNLGSSSVHDLYSTSDNGPSLAFTRVQSLKSPHSVQVVAGKRKKGIPILPNSYTNLSSISVGSGNSGGQNGSAGKKHKKNNINRSDSGELWDKQALESKNNELLATQKLVQDLRKRQRELTDRLSEQAQRHLQDSEKFEDILLGSNRPTVVIQRYKELFSQGRMEALDAMEGVMQELGTHKSRKHSTSNSEFSTRVLLDVLKFSYKEATSSLEQLHSKWKDSLGVSPDNSASVAVQQLESAVALYLRRASSKHDVTSIIQNVTVQLSLKYSDSEVFKRVSGMEEFCSYVRECGQVCWDLCVQTPPMIIDYSETEFNFDLHTRFHQSNVNSSCILLYHWPTLLQTTAGPISRGVVQT